MTKDTSKSGPKFNKGDTVVANGWAGIVISPTKGIRTMCFVYGWGVDGGDVYTAELRPATEANARELAVSNGHGARFEADLKKYRAEKLKDDKRKAAKAAKAVAL